MAKEKDISKKLGQGKAVLVKPGYHYLVLHSAGTALEVKWAVWGTGAFKVKVKGVRFALVIPNPFNTDWKAAKKNWHKGRWGKSGKETVITHYVVVKVKKPIYIRATAKFTGKGGIKMDFPADPPI